MILCHPCPWKRPPTRRPGVRIAKRKESIGYGQRVHRWTRIHEPMKLKYKPWRQRRERHQGKALCVECL